MSELASTLPGRKIPATESFLEPKKNPELDSTFIEIESNNIALKASDLSLELKVLDSVSIDAKNYQFALPIQVFRKGKFLLGLTGEDWPNRKIQPLAWYLRVYSKDGETVASTQSFLWSHQ